MFHFDEPFESFPLTRKRAFNLGFCACVDLGLLHLARIDMRVSVGHRTDGTDDVVSPEVVLRAGFIIAPSGLVEKRFAVWFCW